MPGLTELHWREPLWLLLALQPLLLWALRQGRRQRALSYADAPLRPWAMRGAWTADQPWRLALAALAWLLFAVAAAGPRLPEVSVGAAGAAAQREDVVLAVVLDVGESMRGDNGLQALLALRELTTRLQGERLALIAYAGRAGLIAPPTSDYAALRFYAEHAPAAFDPAPARALDEALRWADAAGGDGPAGVLLISDGAEPPGDAALAAAESLRARERALYVLELSAQGRLVELARLGGGLHAAADTDPWPALYQRGIARLPSAARAQRESLRWRELYAWALAPGVLLLALSLWPIGRPDRAALALALPVAGVLLALPVQAPRADETDAYAAFQARRFALAQARYAALPGYAARMGEGASAYRRRDYARAAEQFLAALLAAEDANRRADALYNLGNAYFQDEDLAAAVEAYTDALRYRPDHERAQHNLWLAQSRAQALGERSDGLPGGRASSEYGRAFDIEDEDLPDDAPAGDLPPAQAPVSEQGEAVARGALERQQGWTAGEGRGAPAPAAQDYLAGLKKLELIRDQPGRLLRGLLEKETAPEDRRP